MNIYSTKYLNLMAILIVMAIFVSCSDNGGRFEILRHKNEVLKQREIKDKYFKNSEYSPLLKEDQWKFVKIDYFPVDFNLKVKANFLENPDKEILKIQTTSNSQRNYISKGRLEFNIDGKTFTLMAYQNLEEVEAGGASQLFIPFKDSTSGKETYGGGRYLDIEYNNEGTVIVDFNFAYNPYCAYNSNFSCPIPPQQNFLNFPVKAGEKNFSHLND